jgi:hypothetical protein
MFFHLGEDILGFTYTSLRIYSCSGGKAVINSSVKRALFQEESPPPEAEGQADSAAQTQIGLTLVGDAATPPAPSTAASEEKPTNRYCLYVVPCF